MNASSLLMVIRSRTFGMLCSVTFSAVSNAAAITGSAEFFAPLIATVPRSAFPPLIRNLSIPSLYAAAAFRPALFPFIGDGIVPTDRDVPIFLFPILLCVLCALCVESFSSFSQRRPQISPGPRNLFPRFSRPNSFLQHHQSHAQIVSPGTLCLFRCRHTFPARLRQNPQRPLRKLLIRQHHVDHQVFIHMPQPSHHRCTEHVQHHFLRRPRLQPCRPRQHFRPHFRRNHNLRQPSHWHPQVGRHRHRRRLAPPRILQSPHHIRRRPARRNSHHHVAPRQFLCPQIPLPVPLRILRPFHRFRNRPPSSGNQH